MAITILHNPDFIEWQYSGRAEHLDLDKMTPVARIETDDLEVAFKFTQHLDRPWWERQGIEVLADPPEIRSTSVGDVLVKDGDAYAVESFGFTYFDVYRPDDDDDLEGPEPDGPHDDPPLYSCPVCDHSFGGQWVYCPACGAWTGLGDS